MTTSTDNTAALNDQFRTGANPGLGRWLITRGVQALPAADQLAIFQQVRSFAAFTKDNDPHGERDFGSFTQAGEKIFWKIDYYDRTLTAGSEDPSDAAQTQRVLTIMLASEY